ncbi:MAG: aminotransferase class IV family protein [Solirubrobacterales bacterium]|nr:aminotransferase class IV family protein [Solirubrobacterales bacterium]
MASAPGSLASLDGEIMLACEATIPATDEGLIRGDGVFEVMRVYDGQPFALDRHLARLERSARNLRLPLDLEAIRADVWRLAAQAGSGPEHELLRVVVTRGGRRLLLTEPLPANPATVRLATVTYAPTRVLDGVKSLSYGANMLAGRLAREGGFDEALLVTPHGRVHEAPTSSIFWVKDTELFTPPLDEHILASITRAIVIEGTGAVERSCTLDELLEADEAFLASTAREVHPVSAIDEHTFDAPGPVTARTAEIVAGLVRQQLADETGQAESLPLDHDTR